MNEPRKTPDAARACASYKIEKMLPFGKEDEEAIVENVRYLWRRKDLDKLRAVALLEAIRHRNAADFWHKLANNIKDMQA